MKLQDGIKLKGNPVNIPDCPRSELPQFFLDMGYKVGAEIGVYKGAFTEQFCRIGLKMYAIDPWIAYRGAGRSQNDQDRQDFLFAHTTRTLSPYPDCTIIRNTSLGALDQIEANSLDFVYIDGDHTFPNIAQDIYYWSQKVRSGGAVSGHDYFITDPHANNVICHVQPVVDAFVKIYQIPNLYTFGQMNYSDRQSKDDRTPSWMFFKP